MISLPELSFYCSALGLVMAWCCHATSQRLTCLILSSLCCIMSSMVNEWVKDGDKVNHFPQQPVVTRGVSLPQGIRFSSPSHQSINISICLDLAWFPSYLLLCARTSHALGVSTAHRWFPNTTIHIGIHMWLNSITGQQISTCTDRRYCSCQRLSEF